MDFRNLKILMTGAGSGFGLELTTRFLEAGAIVFVVSRTAEKMKMVHPNLTKYSADLSNQKGIDDSFEAAIQEMGDIDFYYANSGFGYHEKFTPDWDKIEKTYKLNVFSPSYALGKMIEYKGDKPFNFAITSSGVSYIGIPGMALYCGSKAAVHRFAESVRYELSKDQKVHLVYPSAMKTPFFKQTDGEPLPSPQQDTGKAAENTIKGLKKDKKSIFPLAMVGFGFLPARINEALSGVFRKKEATRFFKWINSK